MNTTFFKGKSKGIITVSFLIIFAFISKIFGFIRSAVLAYYFGTSQTSDTLNLLIYPTELVLSFVVNNTIITALTSYFSKAESEHKAVFWKVIHFYQMLLLAITTIIIAILVVVYRDIFPGYWLASGVAAILYGISGIIQSYLNYHLKFYRSSLQDLISQVALTAGIVGAHSFGIGFFSLFVILSGLVRIIIQLPDLLKIVEEKALIKVFIPLKLHIDKELLIYILPLLLSFLLSNIPGFIILATMQRTGEGLVAAYNYATKVITIFNPIFVIPFTTYIIPKMNKMLKENEISETRLINILAFALITITSLLCAVVFAVFASPIAKALYFRGRFDADALKLTATMLRYLSMTIIGYAVMYYLLQIVLLYKRDVAVLYSYIVGTIVAVIILFIPFHNLDLKITLSLTLGTFVSIIILLFAVARKPKL